jgi:hypothetical protein
MKKITPKQVVTISRKWNNPEIMAFMDDVEVGAQVGLSDFVEAMVRVMGSPTMILTKKQLRERMFDSCHEVLEEVKRATNHL